MNNTDSAVAVLARTSLAALAASVCATAAHAQAPGPSPIDGLLSGLPGLTAVQRSAGGVTESICPFLPTPEGLGSGEARLSDTCTRLVVSALS
ncbi:MAG: hypothetical protein KDH20_18975, partial [Rhodocyclaceae bacterium]|nr:hypothetical protein [Rhodocyclaceae bacterium]